MNAFKRKLLATSVLAGLGAVAGAAHAVYLDPSGQGQMLIYPYYTVQAGHNTYVSVVNTRTSGVKVVKVRFREGKNSREVLDFNLYLSPSDVWSGAVIPADAATTNSVARLVTSDVSCTNPPIPSTGVDFRNYAYSGTNDDLQGTGLDRTREGYVEMIEMGVLSDIVAPGNAAVHGSAGVPTCTGLTGSDVVAVRNELNNFTPGQGAPTGGMNGTATLINVTNGQDSGYNAVALSNLTALAIYANIGNDNPSVANADAQSVVINNNNTYLANWATAAPTAIQRVNAVSSVIAHSNVINEYILDNGTKSNTDWVLTFPTKNRYVTSAAATSPFSNVLAKGGGACEPIGFGYFNREEAGASAAGVDFSPLPPGGDPSSLCWESTVISIRNGAAHMPTATTSSGVLGSVNNTNITIRSGFQNGWANLSFAGTNATSVGMYSATSSITRNILTGASVTGSQQFLGLPVVGFMVRTFNNGTLGSFQANYGSAFDHKYVQTIFPIQ
jgi:hypothetical protein